ncbi:MAG: type II toxin-antitoxin system VapC family toxin [Candidatus Aenigmarchaeota archaeon]|nr:type II toxin-antitoxin system VapC family toxin [Candidatus Aenigmarchaeota archaeon]
MFILDTSALLEVIRGRVPGTEVQKIVGNQSYITTSFTQHEILVGMKPHEMQKIGELFNDADVLAFDSESSVISARIFRELRQSGSLVNVVDVFIAAICMVNDGTLITLDKSFRRIHGLKCEII